MQIQFTARHCEIGDDLRLFAEERLRRLERFAQDVHAVRVILVQERQHHTAEITMRLNHHDIVVKETHNDPRVAIEQAAARVEEHVRRFKEKRIERRRADGTIIADTDSDADADAANEDEA